MTRKPSELEIRLYNAGYRAGHSDTVEGCFTDIVDCEMSEYHADVVGEIIEELQPKERPFGSFNIGAEMAVTMGADPRPYLSNGEIAEQLRLSGKTREEWDAAWDRVCRIASDHSDVPF